MVDPEAGLVGWALDLAKPGDPLQLELMAGETVLERRPTELPRDDVHAIEPGTRTPGFRFSLCGLRALVDVAGAAPDGRLRVRVAGTDCLLGAQAPLPLAADIVSRTGLGQAAQASPRHAREIQEIAEDPLGALKALAKTAEHIRQGPLAPADDRVDGFIEAMSQGPRGCVWLLGWMRRDCPLHFPAVLSSDGTTFPAGVAAATYDREDLPQDAVGFLAVASTGWRPPGDGQGPRLFFGDAAERCLPSTDRFSLLNDAECVARVAPVRESLSGPCAPALRRLLARTTDWLPDVSRATELEVRAHLERVLVLPGFGCLAEGWLLSPLQPVEDLALQMGGATLAADAVSLTRKSRPDLLGAATSDRRMADSAGFVAAFLGDVQGHDLTAGPPPVLKVLLPGGASANLEVGRGAVRVLGHSAAFEDVLQLYPAVEGEPFFPALARCIGDEAGRGAREVVAFRVWPARSALVAAVPDDPHDMALLLSELATVAGRKGEAPPPMALVARAGDRRADVLTAYRELSEGAEAPVSLFFVADPGCAIHALGRVLDHLGAERFAYVGPGVFPTDVGWSALLGRLASAQDGPAAVAVADDGSPPATGRRGIPAECFAWDQRGFAAWLAAQPMALGGGPAAAPGLPAQAVPLLRSAGARRGRRGAPSRFTEAVNRQLAKRDPEVRHA